ncbi:MAG TPA: AAA family ATPase [Pyrinomonadaceae bacterium]|jgi:pilus assembly protein CpaE|nr:AAA family ATPase [Pyrinomonadaceae bacterium]
MKRNLTFIVLCKDATELKEMGRALNNHAGTSVLLMSEDPEQVFTETARLRPSAVIVNLVHLGEPGLKLVQRLCAEFTNTAVICASRDSSPDLILRSMRCGARDFIRLPINEEELSTVIERTNQFANEHANEEPAKRGRAIAVFSSKGGCGVSLIATNLAMLQTTPTVLLDLNLQSGDLELMLGVRPKFSLADIVENRDRLDEALLTSYLTQRSKNVSLLAAPLKAESAEDIEPRHIYEVMELLRQRFDTLIIDTPHSFDAVTISALDHADQILMVLTLEIHAIRSTRRALEIFDRLGYPRKKIRLVVNRWSKNIELDQKQVEDFLGERVVGYVQSDYRAAVNSINLGQPLIESAPTSRVTTDLRAIAAKLFEGQVEPPSTPATGEKRSFNSIFRRQQVSVEDFGLTAALDRANS